MSTQSNARIPFSFAHSQSPIRLLELSPPLLSLVTSSSPSSPVILKLKAAPTPAKTTTARAGESHAVVCTPTQTFSLRHVHCSNSILLVQPSPTPPCPLDSDDIFPPASIGIKAVSTATSWLELILTTPDCIHLLRERLPLYHGWTDDVRPSSTSVSQEQTLSRAHLLDSLPVSDAEFTSAWDAILAFETDEGAAYRPSPGAILKTLSEVFTSATAESFPLSSPAGFDVAELLAVLDDTDLPAGLVAAALGVICEQLCEGGGVGGNKWRLGVQKCCAFVGKTLLEDWVEQLAAGQAKHDMLYISFMTKWKAAIPEECMDICRLETIKGWYTLPTPNTIRFAPSGGAESAGAPTAASSGATAKAIPPKNKWHERLGKKR